MPPPSPQSYYLSDQSLAELARNSEYRHHGKVCPVCLGERTHRYKGEELSCPDDDYGHPALRLARLYWLHNISLQYQIQLWDEYPHPDIKSDIESYITMYPYVKLQGLGLTFASKVFGVGKTWAATHVLKELVKQGVDGWFVPCWEIYGYKDIEDWDERNYKIKKVQESELLVLDDVKEPYTERQTEYYGDKLEEFIRPRTDANLPTIITTNMDEQEFTHHFPRISSLLNAKNRFFVLEGKDARSRESDSLIERSMRIAFAGETAPIQ